MRLISQTLVKGRSLKDSLPGESTICDPATYSKKKKKLKVLGYLMLN
jgi:hypothetical protein